MELDSLILEYVRAIRRDIHSIRGDIQTLRAEMTATRHTIRSMTALQDHDHADIAEIKARVDRIEARLELAD